MRPNNRRPTKIVNSLSAKLELGSPMICMYLLGHPDHYTSHKFVTFYWQSYITNTHSAWITGPHDGAASHHPNSTSAKVTLLKTASGVIGLSYIDDYSYCPTELEHLSLYDSITTCTREK
ncbi:hypothetical protein L208DRAFT_1243264, partial [Tricholoma matsutake]